MAETRKLYLARVTSPLCSNCHWLMSKSRAMTISSTGLEVVPTEFGRLLNNLVTALDLPVPAFEMFITDEPWDARRYIVGGVTGIRLINDIAMTVEVTRPGAQRECANGMGCHPGVQSLGLTGLGCDKVIHFALVPTLVVVTSRLSTRNVREVDRFLTGTTYFLQEHPKGQ